MASYGGGGAGDGRGPAVVGDLIEARENGARLRDLLVQAPDVTRELMDGMMSKLSSALVALNTGGPSSGGRRRKAGAAAGPHRRPRRRSHSPICRTVVATTLDDGKSWRKYGQKGIQNSTHPRSYFRCAHRQHQGCKATRQVQLSETNPSEFVITYFGEHTCRDPSTIAVMIEASGASASSANLISFGSSAGANTTTVSNAPAAARIIRDATATGPWLSPIVHRSPLPPAESASEEALSSLTPGSSPAERFMQQADGLATVVGSAGRTTSSTMWSALDWGGAGDMAGGGTGGFPSSPSSLGFMAPGSFGNIGDDDLFGFDL